MPFLKNTADVVNQEKAIDTFLYKIAILFINISVSFYLWVTERVSDSNNNNNNNWLSSGLHFKYFQPL